MPSPGPRLICGTCGSVVNHTLADRCDRCVTEDVVISDARNALAYIEDTVAKARRKRARRG